MADLQVTVAVGGAAQAAQGLDNVGAAATRAASGLNRAEIGASRTSSSMDMLFRKMRSGEVLRNAASSFALMGMQGGNATDKIAALSGALASIPGPVGIISSVVAVGATVWGVYTKSTEATRAALAKLGEEMDALKEKRKALSEAIAARVGASVAAAGPGVRGLNASGASESDASGMQRFTPGSAADALKNAAVLGSEDSDTKAKVMAVLENVRKIGKDVTAEVVSNALAAVKESAANNSISVVDAQNKHGAQGGMFGRISPTEGKATMADLVTQALTGSMGSASETAKISQQLANVGTGYGRAVEANLAAGESPAVAESGRVIEEATRGAFKGEAFAAITQATKENKGSLDGLTKAVRDLDRTIGAKAREIEAAAPKDTGGWRWAPGYSN